MLVSHTDHALVLLNVSILFQVLQVSSELTRCKKPGCGGALGCALKSAKVTYYGVEQRFSMDVPVKSCIVCQEPCAVSPMRVNCMPGSAVKAWHVARAQQSVPFWVDLEVVRCLDSLHIHLKRASTQQLAVHLESMHVGNGCEPMGESAAQRVRNMLNRVRERKFSNLSTCT